MTYREIYEKSLTVSRAVEVCQSVGEQATTEGYYVRGTVSDVSISTSYGDANVTLTEYATNRETGETKEYTLILYRVKSFNGEKFSDESMIQKGDEVIAYGQLVNYKGTTPEMTNGYLVALNGNMSANNGATEPTDPTITYSDTVKVYINCLIPPYLYTWGAREIAEWPGVKMTEQREVNGINFWYMAISTTYEASLNLIFNDGNGNQTTDINGVTGTHYYWYDGMNSYEDITEEVLAGTFTSRDYIMTALITNPDFRNDNSGWKGSSYLYTSNSVAYSGDYNYDFYQEITVPKAGLYEVQVQGFQEQDDYRYFKENKRDVPVYLYANGSVTPLKSIYEERITDENAQTVERLGILV
ncbi:MAG: starch-binding protein [Prevotella sp.]|nr:starch-binding protein [Prevotella sp.]